MNIQVIIGSTRPGRVSDRIGKWIEKAAEENNLTGFEIVDLADYNLPLFDEAISPRYNQNRIPNEFAKKWIDKLAEADAYVFVTPEYNHSIPGALKNALDYIDYQLKRKPAAIVSHGSVGGARAAEHLKMVLLEVGAIVIPPAVAFVGMLAMDPTIEENGEIQQDVKNLPYGPQTTLVNVLNELVWYSEALKIARSK